MTTTITRQRVAAAAATLLATLVAACQPATEVQQFIAGGPCKPGPIVRLIPDASDSAAALQVPGGLYETAINKVIAETAKMCGELYAAPADGNAIGNTAGWVIDAKTFRQITVGGNEALGAAAREKKAKEELRPKVRALLTKTTNGSDFLGAMRRVALAARNDPKDRRQMLVLVFDGVVVLPGHYSLYKSPIDTPQRRKKFIDRLKRGGEIPDLEGFEVYLGGLGVGVSNRETAKAVISFWQELIPLTGARLVSADSTLRFP